MWPLWTELCSEQNLYVESLIPNVTVFGARTYNEVKRVEWWQGLNQIEVVRGEDSRGLCLRVNRKKGPVSRRRQPLPASRDSTKTSPNTILTLHFLPPELWENECLLFKPPSYGIFCSSPSWLMHTPQQSLGPLLGVMSPATRVIFVFPLTWYAGSKWGDMEVPSRSSSSMEPLKINSNLKIGFKR